MKSWNRIASRAAENGVFWMIIFLGTIGVLSLFSAGRQAIRAGSEKVRAIAEGRNHKCGDEMLPICSVENGNRQISLTFELSGDIGRGLERVLEVLAEQGETASFFAAEDWMFEHPREREAILAGGHDLGVLGKGGRAAEELGIFNRQLDYGQGSMGLFRPFQGKFDDGLITSVCGMGYYPVCWDVDSEDWKDYGAEAVARQVLENDKLKNGSIIRFHGGARYTPQALEEIIPGLKEMGYELTPLSGLVIPENYRLTQEGRQEQKIQ